ncbi:kinase-like protein [Suillus decipiens]|nr:kinase-like protein [Suillus decipiens]
MRHRDNSDAPYTTIVRQALEGVCIFLEVPLSEIVLCEAVQTILQPGLYADAEAAVGTLLDQGYALLGLPIPDAKSFSLPQLPSGLNVSDEPAPLSNLFDQNHSMFSGLLKHCRLACSTVEKNQALVVTSSCYQVMEPASMASFPTVLVRRPGDLGSGVNLRTSHPTLLIDGLQALPVKLQNTSLVHCPLPPRMQPPIGSLRPLRVRGMYQMTTLLGAGSSGRVTSAFHVLTGSEVALKSGTASEDTPDTPCAVPSCAAGHPGIPSCKWSGLEQGSYILVLERLGANLEQLRKLSRGKLPWKTVVMLGVQMLNRVEFAHSRGVILRDIKPENFAMGVGEKYRIVYLFDFSLAKLYVDPSTGKHIPYREGRVALGTMPYSSYNVHFGRDIYAPNKEAYLHRMGEMKAGSAAFRDLLARSPAEFTTYFDHCRSLKFEEKPNYGLLRQLFVQIMEREGWAGDTRFDPLDGSSDKGTLVPEEYKLDVRFTGGDLTTLQFMLPRYLWRKKIVSGVNLKEKHGRSVLMPKDLNSAAFN